MLAVVVVKSNVSSFEDCIVLVSSRSRSAINKIFADKGFGIISGEREVLSFPIGALEGTSIESLRVGHTVTCEKGRGPTGPRAQKVRPQ